MAYTVTTLSNSATLVGTSGNDTVASAVTKDIQVSSKEGIDTLTLTGGVETGSVGMGGGIDTVAITTAVAEKLSVSLGDAADNFSSTQIDANITVRGQGGKDTFTLDALAVNSRYGGGQGADVFRGTGDGGNLGADSTITGGSENDSIGIATSGIVLGARAFINGNVGADTIFLNNAAAATVRGGSENDTITVQAGGADGSKFYGDKGNDTITDLAGDSELFGGEGNDTLIGGEGVDTLTGGAGADLYSVADVYNAANAIELTEIKGYSVSDSDSIGGFGIADLEQGATIDLVSAGQTNTSIAAGNAVTTTTLTGATNLTATSGRVLVASSSTAFTTDTLSDALETGGTLALTLNGAMADDSAFLVIYDNNVDTFIAEVVNTSGGAIADNTEATAGEFTIANLVELDGFNDATALTAAQIAAFTA